MGRRSSPSRGSAFGRGRSPSPTRARAAPPPPPKAVTPQPAATAQVAPTMTAPAGGMAGGLMANVASTAAGVAIGHTVGHAITGAFMGGPNNEPQQQQPARASEVDQYQQPQQPMSNNQQDPCRFELEQFLFCAQTQSNDLSLCEGFNQVLRECKTRYGGQQSRMYQ